ncbi:secretin and TonB N-terminal domain-containing protein [bacterium]|nr:secretin and TonB N-terminal domain-containing protein [bacterium]
MNRKIALALTLCLVLAGAGWQPMAEDTSPITLNFENEELSSVLRMLSLSRQINIIAGPEVSGQVSVNLYNVTFEEALRSILAIGGFTYFKRGDIIFVTTEARKSELPLAGRDLEIRIYRIEHANANSIVESVTQFLSPSGTAVLNKEERFLVVEDSPDYLARIENLLHVQDIPARQVMISVRILKVNHDDSLEIGAQFGPIRPVRLTDFLTNGFAQDLTSLAPSTQGFFWGATQANRRLFMDFLSKKGKVKVLAAPELLALNGQEASLIVGSRKGFRITTVTETASLESVEFLEVGIQLDITPYIAENGLIRLEIHPKVSSGDVDTETGLPSEDTTEVDTVLMVQDGKTVIIGGLLNSETQRVRQQVPILGDIPIIGIFFGRNKWSTVKTELILMITPTIVGPEFGPAMSERFDHYTDIPKEFSQEQIAPLQTQEKNITDTMPWAGKILPDQDENQD